MIDREILQQNEINFSGVIDGSQAYVLAKIIENTERDVLFIATEDARAKQICDNLKIITAKESLCFFGWDTPAYDLVSPSKSILNKRIEVLSKLLLNKSKQNVILAPVGAVLQKIITKEDLASHLLNLKVKDKVSRDELISFLIDNGFTRESSVINAGEFAVRGGIIDFFVSGQECPYRIDFFGNEIEYIKKFNPETQLATESVTEITIYPAHELIISAQTIKNFEENLISNFGSKIVSHELLSSLKEGVRPNGIEQWSVLFYREVSSIVSYLNDPIIVLDNFIINNIRASSAKIEQLYKERLQEVIDDNKVNITLKPDSTWLSAKEMENILENHTAIYFNFAETSKKSTNLAITKIESFYQQTHAKQASVFSLLNEFASLQYKNKKNVILSASSEGSRDRIHKTLREHEINAVKMDSWPNNSFASYIHLIVSEFEQGFNCKEFVLITEQELFGKKVLNISPRKSSSLKNLIAEANNFTIGELVVHKGYGIARFEGLETVELSKTKHDCLKLVYEGDDKLFVPVENIELITKYGNSDQYAKLDKLGGSSWLSRKAKIREKIKESAEYLLQIAAERAVKKAEIIEPIQGLYEEFCATFPYAETEDQENAINEVKNDLAKSEPMDRLICGDVGFGKTEVSLRAAFMTIKSENALQKRQVALICPTTLLSRQHFKVFSERFKKFGINVGQLSRLVTKKDSDKVIQGIESGHVDMVIGTHSLLSDKIKFKHLSLLIIDEEQHFGVAQKEKLKKMKEDVHVLSMSATPIPRTLQMSLSGIKNLSLIATPPVNRLVTKTNVVTFDPVIIREALLKEYFRGGQVFYVCPRISDLPELELKLKEIVPSLKVVSAHGQMPPNEIDKTMNDFYEGKFDVLLSTSIVESGLDIPKANTIIVHKAYKFGLGQLYQLKGRVGRSNISSYAYFVIPANKNLTPLALRRLEILQSLDSLGSGFSIASHDMDIRGYGNLIGEAQSGHIKEVGVELYQDMLAEAVKALKTEGGSKAAEDLWEEKWIPQINLGISILIPEEYVKDFDLRLSLYRRVSELKDEGEIMSFAAEMIDRFGPLPEEAEHLLLTIKLKQICLRVGIQKIDVGDKGIMLKLLDNKTYDSEKLLNFINAYPTEIKLRPENKIFIAKVLSDNQKRKSYLEKLLKAIEPILQ